MEYVNCILCEKNNADILFSKPAPNGELFQLNRCRGCGLEYLTPRPDRDEIEKYYTENYFKQRTDRGYNNYFSDTVRIEIERVFKMNLSDLGFFAFEEGLSSGKRSLDIGCAAGYFVSYLQDRGWDAAGIDVSRACVDAALGAGLKVTLGDYLAENYAQKFDLITMWASIEHLHDPHLFIEKIYHDLNDRGCVYISTCRTGGLNFKNLFGSAWRFYNFPEHMYFFSRTTMKQLLGRYGFSMTAYKTYGSGVGTSGSITKTIADIMAKKFNMGDMMIISVKKS